MFLIAGVQPKTRRIDDAPRRCPSCGSVQAYTTRIDHYLSLFFIPLVRVKRGEPFLMCERCQGAVDDRLHGPPQVDRPTGGQTVCAACGRTFDSSFNYCPHCGQRA